MDLGTVVFLAGGLWVCVLGLFVALCRAAKLGDEAMMRAMVIDAPARGRRRARPDRSHLRLVGGRALRPAPDRR